MKIEVYPGCISNPAIESADENEVSCKRRGENPPPLRNRAMLITNSKFIRVAVPVLASTILWACTPLTTTPTNDAYTIEAWTYFRKKCETEAGEKIYKTYPGVKSVQVIKPLPEATEKDLYDQFWYGDPYSNASYYKRGELAALKLVLNWISRSGNGIQRGIDFVEIKNETGSYTRIYRPESNDKLAVREPIQMPISKLGVAWEDISTPEDRRYWVAASRLRVIDLTDNNVVAERVGFLIEAGFGSTVGGRRPWLTSRGIGPNGRSCPDAHDATDQWFVNSVFAPYVEK